LTAVVQHAPHAGKRTVGRHDLEMFLFWEKHDMPRACKGNAGIKQLLTYYRNLFRIPENLNHYSARDYKIAEKKFVKYAVLGEGTVGQKHVS
jgi:hypothetical protein